MNRSTAKVGVDLSNVGHDIYRGCNSMVEPQPSKLVTWVRFPSPAPIDVRLPQKSCLNYPRHANPAICILRIEIAAKERVDVLFRIALPLYAIVAQLAERRFCKPYVGGSIPLGSSIMTADMVCNHSYR